MLETISRWRKSRACSYRSRKEVMYMLPLYVCAHSLELITRAVAAYKPAKDEEEDHSHLQDYLRKFAEEQPSPEELNPEDIPF